METLHAILKEAREAAGLKQTEAAAKLGFKSREMISKIENGKTPSMRMLNRMIEVYNLNYSLPELMAMSVRPPEDLSDDELQLLTAVRNKDVDRAMKIIARIVYKK